MKPMKCLLLQHTEIITLLQRHAARVEALVFVFPGVVRSLYLISNKLMDLPDVDGWKCVDVF